LRGRKQYVDINGSHSTIKVVLQGVPQGSNLGPTLFSIYVNDIFNNFNSTPVLYADDTCLNVEAPTMIELEILLNQEIKKANDWMNANKLTINAVKTHAMVFSPNINNSIENISLSCNECPITMQKTVKYIRFTIDNKLDFHQHIKTIEKKVACAIGIL